MNKIANIIIFQKNLSKVLYKFFFHIKYSKMKFDDLKNNCFIK